MKENRIIASAIIAVGILHRVKLMKLAVAMCCVLAVSGMTSCSIENNDNPTPTPEPESQAEYTILYYGTGGANLDQFFIRSIPQFCEADPVAYKHVNVVVQYKYSTSKNMQQNGIPSDFADAFDSKTVRFAIDPSTPGQYVNSDNYYGADNADVTCPDSLTNFINWAAKNYPAKKYMLILCGHGQGYVPNGDLPATTPTRGLFPDDGNNNRIFSVHTLKQGIASANVKIETLYLWACLMNNLQYAFELKDVCKYMIASTYSMVSAGWAYGDLVSLLARQDIDIEQKLATYSNTIKDILDNTPGLEETMGRYRDQTVTRTASLDQLGVMMREFTDRLCNTYTNGTEQQKLLIDKCTASAVKVQENYPHYDAAKYMESIMKALPEVYSTEFYNQMANAFNDCLVFQNYSSYLVSHNYQVDYSVLLGADNSYLIVNWYKDPQTGDKTPCVAIAYHADGTTEFYQLEPLEDNSSLYQMVSKGEGDPWGSTFADTFCQLEFDRIVGWSRWLKMNHQQPNLFCPHDLDFELPDGDVSGNPNL